MILKCDLALLPFFQKLKASKLYFSSLELIFPNQKIISHKEIQNFFFKPQKME